MKGMRRASLVLVGTVVVVAGQAGPDFRPTGREDHTARRHDERHGLRQPVQGMLHVRVRDVAPELQHAVRLLGRGPRRSRSSHRLRTEHRLHDVDVPDPRRRVLARRRAAHRGGHRVHVPVHPRQRAHVLPTTCRSTRRSDPGPLHARVEARRSRRSRRRCRRTSRSCRSTSGVRSTASPRRRSAPSRRSRDRPGPFQLTEWETGQFWRMEAVPGHFFGEPTIDEVVYHVYGNDEAMVQALKSKEIDFAYDIPPTLADSLDEEHQGQRGERGLPRTWRSTSGARRRRTRSSTAHRPRRRKRTTRRCTTTRSGWRSRTRSTSRRSRTRCSRARPTRRIPSSRRTRRSGTRHPGR